jgi:6-phosphogluconolactonase
VVIDPSGTFAYVANQNSNTVSVYALDSTTGALTQVSGSPFAAGVNPRTVAID